MSRRSFDRRFLEDMGVSAMQWLISQCVEQARSLLDQGQGNIEQPATEVGFDSATLLRHHFKKALAITPGQYRQQFIAKR